MGRRWGSAASTGPVRIIVLDPDPYLLFLLEREFPEGAVRRAPEDLTAAQVLADTPDLVVGSQGDPRLSEARDLRDPATKLLAVSDGTGRPLHPADGFDGVLVRPIGPAEVGRAVRSAMGLRTGTPRTIVGVLERFPAWLATLRLAALMLGGLVAVTVGSTARPALAIFVTALAYTALRAARGRTVAWLAWADVGVAAALIAVTGGVDSSYILFATVVALGSGVAFDQRRAVTAGLVLWLGAVVDAVASTTSASAAASELIVWLAIFPLMALITSVVTGGWRAERSDGSQIIAEANRTLSKLHDIARAIPRGFETGSIASAVLEEIKDAGAPAGVLFVEQGGLLSAVGSFGWSQPVQFLVERESLDGMLDRPSRVTGHDRLPDPLAEALTGYERWFIAPLRHGPATLGLLAIAWKGASRSDEIDLGEIERFAEETALALENARLFRRVRELSVDEERRRLAVEIHDGIAQVLTHVHLELEFLGCQEQVDESVRAEASRLARVVHRGLVDVRSTITGLHPSSAEGLAASLREYVRDLRGLGGPRVVFDARVDRRLDPEVEAEVFRVAQEAISNALRHSGGQEVRVSLDGTGPALRLTVEDDGKGIRAGGRSRDGGLGLQAMLERAERIGASLAICERGAGGTRLRMTYPVEPLATQVAEVTEVLSA